MSGVTRYAPRYFVDLLITRGATMVVVAAVFMFPVILGETMGSEALGPDEAAIVWRDFMQSLTTFFTIIVLFGMVGEDIRNGYYRFLFAKPVSPVLYYAMTFAVAAVVFATGQLVTLALFSMVVHPIWPWRALLESGADFLLFGSLMFAFSRVARADWLFAFASVGAAALIRIRWPKAESTFGAIMDFLLPPTNTGPLFPESGVRWEPLLGQLGYAAVMIALALFIIRKVPLGSAR